MRARFLWYAGILLAGMAVRLGVDFLLTRHERGIASLLWKQTARYAQEGGDSDQGFLYDGLYTPSMRPAPAA